MSDSPQQSINIRITTDLQTSNNTLVSQNPISKVSIPTSPEMENGVLQIFLTHQQRIQATYNFQSLFRKKSSLYNIHKNKKKFSKNKVEHLNNKVQENSTSGPSKNVKKGHWLPQQNKKYHWFLELYNRHFILKHLRRTDKIFKTMATFIETRQAEQCRSHHQKMQKKYHNFYQILVTLRKQYYGNCNTSNVRSDLQENGFYIENLQGKGQVNTLVQQNILRQMQNKDSQDLIKRQQKSEQEQNLILSKGEGIEQQEQKQKGNLFFGQNYEQQFQMRFY